MTWFHSPRVCYGQARIPTRAKVYCATRKPTPPAPDEKRVKIASIWHLATGISKQQAQIVIGGRGLAQAAVAGIQETLQFRVFDTAGAAWVASTATTAKRANLFIRRFPGQ